MTTEPNVGDGLAGRDDPPVNKPAASDVHEALAANPDAGVVGRDWDWDWDWDWDSGCSCGCGTSCTASLSAAMSCSRSSRLRENWLSARATAASLPSTNARTARSTSCASASLVIAPGTESSVE